MNQRLVYWVVGGSTLMLLIGCPLRNLHNLSICFGDAQGIVDIPAAELKLEVRLLALQVILPGLGAAGLLLGAQGPLVSQLAGAAAWASVALGGFLWDKWLGNFQGGELPLHSLYACLLQGRSEHTHSVLTNAPLVLSALLTLWVLHLSRGKTHLKEEGGL